MHGGHAVHEAIRAFVERRGALTLAAGPLPSNVLDVLKLAARAGDKLDLWSLDLNIPPQRLSEIAGSFIENVLITPEASHYRVLGVEPDASEARITVHYNWLMNWLGVAGHAPEMRAELVSRIKTAYRELGDATRRAAYDLAMSESLAARLQHSIQPAQYDPRKTPGPGPRRAPSPAAQPRARPQPVREPKEPAFPQDDDSWHTETVFLEPPAPPPEVKLECRPDEVIALLTRPPTIAEPPPVRSRWPLALAALALVAAVSLLFTQDQWRPWLEERLAGRAAEAPQAVVAQAPDERPSAQAAVEDVPRVQPPPLESAAVPVSVDASSEPLDLEGLHLQAASEEAPPEETAAVQVARSMSGAPRTQAAAEASPPATAEPPTEEPVPPPAALALTSAPVVPAEARMVARRVADAYASGDVVAVLNLVSLAGALSQPELASIAADVERWFLERAGEPLAIAATRALPSLQPGEGDRAAVELRAPDDAGLRVILQRDGQSWQVQDVLTIAPTASRSGAGR